MMKFICSAFLFAMAPMVQAQAEQDPEGAECQTIFDTIAKDYLVKKAPKLAKLDFHFCGSVDLDPGSWDLDREASFCSNDGKVVFTLNTKGDLWCSNEKVLGIKQD